MDFPPATKIAATIRDYPRLVLVTHVEPDGDAVGSVLGLTHALRARGQEAVPWPLAPAPARYRFLPGFDELAANETPSLGAGDVVVALDSADPARLPEAVTAFAADGGAAVNIDHHASHRPFGNVSWVEPEAPAAAAMVWAVLREMGADWPRETSLCLYVGLVTDTGNFTYSNTNAWAFEMAADLIRRGVEPAEVERHLHRRFSLPHLNVLGEGLASLRQRDGIAYMEVTREARARTGAGVEDTEGMVDFTRRLAGCRVGVLFREVEGGVRVSFRAAEDLDVSVLAVAHGGGGHAAAAGCFVAGPPEEVKAQILDEVEAWLRRK
ncbi:MAG: DHH family phosphoesterase [Candidatus Coatesbacteria bacterium]|nr:MAG: DHH family phosphoesterase [Candidatus Coatesbacteria bacterium]